jgi:hypothetical protein
MLFKPSWRTSEQIVGSHVDCNNKATRNTALRKMERTAASSGHPKGSSIRRPAPRQYGGSSVAAKSRSGSSGGPRVLGGVFLHELAHADRGAPVSRVKSSVMRS